jgi:hypothetical protein
MTRTPNRISGAVVSLLALSVVNLWFKHHSGRTKNYKIGICCFSAKQTSLKIKNGDWFENVLELS